MQPRNENRWLVSAVLVWILAVAALEFSFVTADPDLWGHIYFGADHWKTGILRRIDPFSFTAAGAPWINHEWLAELIFFLVYHNLGDAGLLIGKLLLGLTVVLLIWRMAFQRTSNPLIAGVILFLAILAMKPGFMMRPQLFSFLLFTVELALLHAASRTAKRYWLAGLPIIMALWVNLHGGFLIGGLLAAVFILTESVAALRVGKRREVAILWGWGIAGALATLVNPFGIGLHRFLVYTLSLPRSITEWSPVPILSTEFMAFKTLAGLVLIALWLRRKDILSWEPLAVCVIGAASFHQQRHMVFFAITAAPFLVSVFAEKFKGVSIARKRQWLSPLSAALISVSFAVVAAGYAYKTVDRYHRCQLRIIVNPDEFPLQAMAFLQANEFRGNLFVDFDWGEYAIWHLYPECKVSIDGRFRTVYPQAVINDFFLEGDDAVGWRRTLYKYPTDILLVRRTPFFKQLVRESSDWVYVYSDDLSMVFIRDLPHNRAMIDRIKKGSMRYHGLDRTMYFPG